MWSTKNLCLKEKQWTGNCTIFGKWPTWRTILFYIFISILYMCRAISCSSSGESFVSIQHLLYVTLCLWPFCVQAWDHTKRSPTQSDIYQIYWYSSFSWWWARDCSINVENLNKYIEKNCASSWSFAKNHNKMHHQQYIKNGIVRIGAGNVMEEDFESEDAN